MATTATETAPFGHYEISSAFGETIRSFVPSDLTSVSQSIDTAVLAPTLAVAERSLGRLDGASSILPNTTLFLYMYVRKEALLSAQIEGTQSSLSDLLLFEGEESPTVPIDDVEEVSNYVAAMNHGLTRLREGFPLSNRLVREIHTILLSGGRGSELQPGEFRTSQNWIGGTRPGNAMYVPPPANLVGNLMGDLEQFLHSESRQIPTLVKAAMSHVQFESIHPFLDGNGRLGRLLITLMLVHDGALTEPLLYLSLYLKTHRGTYYELLQNVREKGEWIPWLIFFLEGVKETSEQATSTAKELVALFANDREKIKILGRAAMSVYLVHDYYQTRPIASVSTVSKSVPNLSLPTIRKSIEHLVRLNILSESTGKKRNQIFIHTQYMEILQRGTEPL